jgi:hypothetical protein
VTTGLNTTNLANKWLDMLRGTAFSAPTGAYVKLHTGDPGATATANTSAVNTRNQVTWSAASGGALTLASLGSYSMTASEIVSHISVWDASTAGNVLFTGALSSAKTVANGDTLSFTSLSVSLSPLMA